MSLIAHSDTERVSEAQVMAVPEPEFTKTWHPVSHARVITALEVATREIGLEIRNREYSLSKLGTKMFGAWDLAEGNSDMVWSLGMRNAIDKSMGLGIASGLRITVCDNLMFNAEFLQFSKHTSGLTQHKLEWMAQDAVQKAIPMMEDMHKRQRSMHQCYIWDKDLPWLLIECMQDGVFAPSAFKRIQECLDEEIVLEANSRTLYAFHGAVTRFHRESNLFRVASSTAKLQGVVDKYVNMRLEEGKYVPAELLN
jgi:hypothetical protein